MHCENFARHRWQLYSRVQGGATAGRRHRYYHRGHAQQHAAAPSRQPPWSPGAGYKIGAVPKHGNQSVFPHQHDTVKMRSVGFAAASQNIHSSHSFFNFQNTLNIVLRDFGKIFLSVPPILEVWKFVNKIFFKNGSYFM